MHYRWRRHGSCVKSRHTSGQSYEHEPDNVTKRPACLTHFSIRLLRSVYYKRLSCASKLITRQLAVPISPSESARRSKVSPYTVWLTPKLVLTQCHLKNGQQKSWQADRHDSGYFTISRMQRIKCGAMFSMPADFSPTEKPGASAAQPACQPI